jgi:UDP-N-acetylmuramate--alanine ligase
MHMPEPEKTGLVHIVGIGGIGMSAIAEVMHTRGYDVQGSDLKESANLERLRAHDIRCLIGHDSANLDGVSYVVISSAVKPGNPEFEAAKERGIPVIRRAEMLAELMRPCATVSITGTHGKTTTTSLIASIFKAGGLDPTVITGGIINDWGTNARIGKGDWMVVEADESDGTFLKLPTQIGVVTNIDPEHMDYWPSIEALHYAFQQFIEAIPFYGLAVACIDHPVVRELVAKLGGAANGRRTITYGVARDADIKLMNLRPDHNRITFDARLGYAVKGGARKLEDLTLPVLGHYNALNALAALAAAVEAGVGDDVIRQAFASFSGVKRRFSRAGDWQGVAIYDDYAHHPVEIAAVLRAARMAGKGRILAVVQPHRYTRLQSLFNEFSACLDDADIVVVTPVYSAGEAPIPGIDRDELASGLRRHGHPNVHTVEDEQGLVETIASVAKDGDLVVGLGAGTITDWINALPKRLAAQGARHERSARAKR